MSGFLKNILKSESGKCHNCMKKINIPEQNNWSHFRWITTEEKKHPIKHYDYCKECYDKLHEPEKIKGLNTAKLPCHICDNPIGKYSWYHIKMYRGGGKQNDFYFINACEECYVNLGETAIDERFQT